MVHHADNANFSGLSKTESYEHVLAGLKGLIVNDWVADLANAASLLWFHFHSQPGKHSAVNWAGFYIRKDENELTLGPFQGKVACQTIQVGKGVCGHAAKSNMAQVVNNVEAFPGHIACDSETKSEIVIPITDDKDNVLGVIDIDSTELETFDDEDAMYLMRVAALLAPSLATRTA